ncbi:MAG: hypothetical protein Tsb0033_24320 [Winogradskyella sp.]
MKAYNLIVLIVLFGMSVSYAQDTQSNDSESSISINLGQSSQNKFTKSKPAQLVATFPSNDTIPNSYLINGFLEIEYLRERLLTFSYTLGIAYEVQKNTLIEKEQDVKQIGVTSTQFFANDYQDVKGQFILSENLKYSKDFIKKTNMFQAHIGFKYEDFRPKKFFFVDGAIPLIHYKNNTGGLLSFRWDYNLGLGYMGGDENVLMGKANFSISAFPFFGLLNSWIKQPEMLFVSYVLDARAPFFGDTELDINPKRTLTLGLAYEINEKSKVSIGYAFNDGADPFSGLDNQDFDTLSFQINFTLNPK